MKKYFQTDDGTLPEVVVRFSSQADVEHALRFIAGLTTKAHDTVSLKRLDHFVLHDLAMGAVQLPAIGIYVGKEVLILDYRMGDEWATSQIEAFFHFLEALRAMDGKIAAPWWGSESEAEWSAALAAPNPSYMDSPANAGD